MEENEAIPEQQEANIANEAMGSLGVDEADVKANEMAADEPAESSLVKDDDPYSVKKRLGQQAKKHQKALRMMQDRIDRLEAHLSNQGQPMMENAPQPEMGMDQANPGNISDIVAAALRAQKALEQRQQEEAQAAANKAHISKQYQDMHSDLEKAGDKYEDFEDVVLSPDVPFTNAMRDATLMLPSGSRADVLYKLGKNREELQRIGKLHPLDQAQEVVKLYLAMMSNNDGKAAEAPTMRPMGSIKTNPVTSHAITEKTSVSDLRKRMKAGWK